MVEGKMPSESREKSEQPILMSEWSERFSLEIQQCITRDGEEDPPGSIANLLERERKLIEEAGRRDALEEATKAICYWCRKEAPVEPTDEWPYLWHRDTASGGLYVCQAAAIRALK